MDEKQKAIKGMAKVMYGVEAFELEVLAEALVNAGYGDLRAFAKMLRNQIMLNARIQTVDTPDDTPDLLSDEVLDVLDETLKEVIGEKE